MYLSVIFPVYNEEKIIKEALLETDEFLSKQGYEYEIIIVDDGSKDNTVSILDNLGRFTKNLTVIKNGKNHGKGYSIRKGMLFGSGRFRVFIDADNYANINHIGDFLYFLNEGYDLAIANRKLKESRIEKHQPLYKEILGSIGNAIIKMLALLKQDDTQCGFKCFSSEFVKEVFPKLTINKWGFDVEVLAVANELGYKTRSVPILWKNRKESRVCLKDYFFTLYEVLKIKANLIRKVYK